MTDCLCNYLSSSPWRKFTFLSEPSKHRELPPGLGVYKGASCKFAANIESAAGQVQRFLVHLMCSSCSSYPKSLGFSTCLGYGRRCWNESALQFLLANGGCLPIHKFRWMRGFEHWSKGRKGMGLRWGREFLSQGRVANSAFNHVSAKENSILLPHLHWGDRVHFHMAFHVPDPQIQSSVAVASCCGNPCFSRLESVQIIESCSHKIIQYPELEWSHEDHQVQLKSSQSSASSSLPVQKVPSTLQTLSLPLPIPKAILVKFSSKVNNHQLESKIPTWRATWQASSSRGHTSLSLRGTLCDGWLFNMVCSRLQNTTFVK